MQSILHHRSNDQPRPGPIGLAIRVVLGAAAIQGLISLLTRLAQLPGTAPNPGGLLAHHPDHPLRAAQRVRHRPWSPPDDPGQLTDGLEGARLAVGVYLVTSTVRQ
jgi:hypothetical protein